MGAPILPHKKKLVSKLRLCIVITALLAAPVSAQTPQVDYALRALLGPDRSALLERLGPVDESGLAARLSIAGDETGDVAIGMFVEARDDAGIGDLRALGADIGPVFGRLAVARVPLSQLPAAFALPSLARIEAAYRVEPVHDSSMAAINADDVRQRSGGDWIGFTGEGAIAGIYDTGIDYRHGDFIDDDGRTRIVGIWDQTSGLRDPEVTFGEYCSPEEIQGSLQGAGSCAERDRNGHGTHVAGSAAGDGSATTQSDTTYRFAGVAPEADILVVKGGENSFFEDNIIRGLKWMKDRAQALGKPLVANLSIGGQYGPHDGTRLYELMIDSLSGPGFMVAVAAGNDGTNRNTTPGLQDFLIHAQGDPVVGATREFTFVIPSYAPSNSACSDFALIQFWYESEDRVTIGVRRPDGTAFSVAAGDSAGQPSAVGTIYVDNASEGPNERNGDYEAIIEVSGCRGGGSPQPGVWTVQVTPTVAASGKPYHMWLLSSRLGAGAEARGLSGFDNRSTVTSPGTSKRAITVGAFVTRICVPVASGQSCSSVAETPGDIAYFSGTGPTRDGRIKPEITAPGRLIVSARSQDSGYPATITSPDGRHVALQGTSMATPHVTGIVTILLAHRPSLTPEEVKDLFRRTSIKDALTQRSTVEGDPGGTPNHQWGWGKADVQAALADLGAFADAATVTIAATAIEPAASSSSAAGTALPLVRLDLAARGPEPVDLLRLGFVATGIDREATLALYRDANGNGALDAGDPRIASAPTELDGRDTVRIELEGVQVPENGSLGLIAAIELSGGAPNGTSFTLAYLPEETRTLGVESGVAGRIEQPSTVVASSPARTTLLDQGELFALSQNPVRSSPVIFNFRSPPTHAAIYTLGGRLVRDLAVGAALRKEWEVDTGMGDPLAPGIYLLVVEVDGERITEKLLVTPEAAGSKEDR